MRSLLSVDGVRSMITDAVTNYATFPPLGTILVVMLGVAVADRSGLLTAMLRAGVGKVPARWMTFAVAFTAMVSHIASDAAYVVLVPLGGLAFRAVGRSPVLGIVVAYVGVSAGYDASPLITPMDAVLSGLTTAAAHTVDAGHTVTPLSNYFFSLGSSVVLAAVITFVTEKVLTKAGGGAAARGGGGPGRPRSRRVGAAPRGALRAAPRGDHPPGLPRGDRGGHDPLGLPAAGRGRIHRRVARAVRDRGGARGAVRPARRGLRARGRHGAQRPGHPGLHGAFAATSAP